MSSETSHSSRAVEQQNDDIKQQKSKRRIKVGQRVLHVIIPEDVFNHAKAQAFLSGVPWRDFVTETLRGCEQVESSLVEPKS